MTLAIARVRPGVKLIGVDGDADVLARAADKARAAGVERAPRGARRSRAAAGRGRRLCG